MRYLRATMLRRRAVRVATLLTAVLCIVPMTSAQADVPNWSGLDARLFAGPIPPPGNTISSVPLTPALSLTGAGPAFRVLYSTVDQHDRPAVSTGAVFLPPGPAPEGGFPVVAWAHGTVGLGDDCTPSALPRSERDDEYLSHWLGEGYAVVASDYVGLGTPGLMSYLNNLATAHGVVDSVIAAHRMGLPLSARWAIVGQSQGGAAAIGRRAGPPSSVAARGWITAAWSRPERPPTSTSWRCKRVRTWCCPTLVRSPTPTPPTSWPRCVRRAPI